MNNSNRTGDVAEFLFDAGSVQRGYVVCRPIHAGTVYDRVVENEGRFYKVQIKSTHKESPMGGYRINLTRNNKKGYTKEMVDVFAVYIASTNTWYLFKNNGVNSIYIKSKKTERYKENWKIFDEEV